MVQTYQQRATATEGKNGTAACLVISLAVIFNYAAHILNYQVNLLNQCYQQQFCLYSKVTLCEIVLLNRKAEVSETSAVLEVFKFIENAAAEFSDEDEEEDSEGRDRTNVESRTVREKSDKLKPSNHIQDVHAVFCFFYPDP